MLYHKPGYQLKSLKKSQLSAMAWIGHRRTSYGSQSWFVRRFPGALTASEADMSVLSLALGYWFFRRHRHANRAKTKSLSSEDALAAREAAAEREGKQNEMATQMGFVQMMRAMGRNVMGSGPK